MAQNKDIRYTMRVSTSWLEDMVVSAGEGPLTTACFIQEAAKIGAPELKRRLNGETVSHTLEDK